MSNKPNYQKVYELLKEKIESGELAVGSLLPSEPKLQESYNVSRTTVRKAVEQLARDGYVSVKQGKGTTVLDYVTMQNLNNVTSFTKTLLEKGYDVKPRTLHVDTVTASGHIANSLQVHEGDLIIRVQRIQLANGKPIAIITNYLPEKIGGSLLNYNGSLISLYQYIEENHNLKPDSSNDRITAKSADFAQAQMLEAPVGTALIHVTRICYSNGLPLSLDVLDIIGSMYEFEVNLLNR